MPDFWLSTEWKYSLQFHFALLFIHLCQKQHRRISEARRIFVGSNSPWTARIYRWIVLESLGDNSGRKIIYYIHGVWSQILTPALKFISCMTLCKLLRLAVFPFLYLQSEVQSSACCEDQQSPINNKQYREAAWWALCKIQFHLSTITVQKWKYCIIW